MSRMLFPLALALPLSLPLAVAAALPAAAQEAAASSAAPAAPLLRLSAEAEAEGVPDAAEITFRAETRAESTAAAMAEVAARMTQILEAVKALGIPARDIATTDLSLYPRTIREKSGKERIEHVASSAIRVRTEDFDLLDDLIDAATGAGASHVQSPAFVISDLEALEDAARDAAVKRLFEKAARMACAAGMRLDGLAALNEGGMSVPGPEPRMMRMAVAEDAMALGAPPVEAGTRQVRASVSGVWRLAPAQGGECASPE